MKIYAHRGASIDFPEMTMDAYKAAVDQGADGMECDVRLTKDNQMLLWHDADMKRTAGYAGRIAEMTYPQIRAHYPQAMLLEELLELAIIELRDRFHLLSKEIIVPFSVNLGENIKITIPQLGDKKQILDLSIRNAKFYRIDQLKQLQIVDPERHSNRIMAQMQKDLRLSEEPRHIECFDNSNIQGTNPASACVVFKEGKPSKKDYRKFNIKTVEGSDDYASMEEVVHRRYRRLQEEGEPLPQLIVIDGGKGQLGAALKALERLGLRGKITIIGIAKRLEELYFPGDPYPLHLDKRSETLKIIQQARDEAHRFSLNHHRSRRSKGAFKSELEGVKGIGPETIKDLIKVFKSVKNIKAATPEQLQEVVGHSKAGILTSYFSSIK